MDEPSSSPPTHLDADRAPLTELIQLYQVEQAMLLAHQREVERRRAAVRAAAEQEASDILLAARREVRRVLVRTRQELVALNAQVRAAGCEAAPGQSDHAIVGDDFQLSAARDVRNVLRDARSELLDLSRDAASLRPSAEEPRKLPPAVATAPPPVEPPSTDHFWSARTYQEVGGGAEDSTEGAPAAGVIERFIKYWRSAAMALAILAVVAAAIVVVRPSSKTDRTVTTSPPAAAGAAASAPATEAPPTGAVALNASTAAIGASGTAGSEMLSLIVDVRRPVWLRINTDGGVDSGRTYQQGERRTIQAAREILVRAGDAGAVFVSLAGGAPVPLGPDGVVRTRRFAREDTGTTDPAVPLQPPARASEVRPVEPAVGTRAAGTPEPGASSIPPVVQRTTAETPTTEQPQRTAAGEDQVTAEREILERHQRWFDAFERGDRATMAAIASENFSLVDQRPERAPGSSGPVRRTIQDLRVQVTGGVGAVLSGRIADTTAGDEATVAMLSEVWIRRGEEWRLVSVRMVPANAVPATLQ